MATRPTDDPIWASDGSAEISAPVLAKQQLGWARVAGIPEKPPFQWFNWWQNLVYQWLLYFRVLFRTSTDVAILDGQANTALGLTLDPTLYRGCKILLSLYVDATTDVYAAIEFHAVSNGTTWQPDGGGQFVPMTNVPAMGLTLNITTTGVVQYSTISYPGFSSAKASYLVTALDRV